MENTNERIASIVKDMSFKRRKPVSQDTKHQTHQLLCSLKEAKNRLDKLHLKLWYAVEKNAYHSVSLTETKQELDNIIRQLENQV